MDQLRQHSVVLEGETICGVIIRLRPMTEDDWDTLLRWNNDPEVLYYAEAADITSYTLDEVQALYRSISEHAHCFIIEANDEPIGECWLQEMNLERILRQFPGQDCRRIDLAVGEKRYWNTGVGATAIRLLTEFAFTTEGVDAIYEPEIGDYNPRSIRAFQKAGYTLVATIPYEPGRKATCGYDLMLTRAEFLSQHPDRKS